jgi:hypothetical protein
MTVVQSLQEILSEFYDRPPGCCRVEIIHMTSATERLPLVLNLAAALGSNTEVREAIQPPPDAPRTCALFIGEAEDGEGPSVTPRTLGEHVAADAAAAHTRRRTPGETGCLLSHVTACREALAAGIEVLALFEDDCRPSPAFSLQALRHWLQTVAAASETFGLPAKPEILLLGTMGAYFALPWIPQAKLVERFNGSHALVLTRPFMEKVVGAYEMLLGRGLTAPVDGLYSALLRAERRWAITPAQDTTFFAQDRALPSYVVGPDGEPMLR